MKNPKKQTAAKPRGRPRKNPLTPIAKQAKNTYKQTSNAAKQMRHVAALNDIGPLPPVADKARRDKAATDLPYFVRTYFNGVCYRPFNKAQVDLMKDAADIILNGGKNAIVMPRGTGKTTLDLIITLWAILYHRNFVVFVGATASMAKRLCDDLKTHLQAPLLMADFPELICFERLKGVTQRCKTQTSCGVLTHVGISANSITFPTFPNVPTSGRCVVCAGLTGSIRGLHRVTDGANSTIIRPDLVLCDDLSKRGSLAETEARERLLNADVLGLAGHDREIAALYCGTIIADDDLTSRVLNNPAWRGKKYKIIDTFGDESRWKKFDEAWKREASGEAPAGTSAAEYKKLQPLLTDITPLDSNLFGKGEVDAIHHARIKYLSVGEAAFASEYQNEPLQLSVGVDYSLSVSDILKKGNGYKRFQIPEECVKVTCGIDVNKYAVSYCVAAFTPQSSCYVIDYGWHTPKKNAPIFTNADNAEEKIIAAISEVLDKVFTAPYGGEIDMICVDSGFASNAVYSAVEAARKRYKGKRIYPSKGWSSDRYELPRNRKMILSRGEECDLRKVFPTGYILHLNSTHFNIKVQKAFLFANGTDGEITLFGDGKKHRPFAEQICNQELTRLTTNKLGKPSATWDIHGHNEALDCLSLCVMANTLQLITLRGGKVSDKAEKKPSERGAIKEGTEASKDGGESATSENNATGEEDKPLTLSQLWKRRQSKGNWATNW